MEPAFAGPPVLTKSAYRGRALATTSLAGTRLCVAPSRRVHSVYTVCVAVDKESKASQKKGPPKKGEEEEELLDEAAMRAAEIHEVLGGLRDFKNRIIDDATKLAKKVRATKKQLEAALASHPDIKKIDGHIAELEEELKVLGDR